MEKLENCVTSLENPIRGLHPMSLPLNMNVHTGGELSRLYLRLRVFATDMQLDCALYFRLNDFYLIGYETRDGLYEIREPNLVGVHMTPDFSCMGPAGAPRDPILTNFNTSYRSLCDISRITVNRFIPVDVRAFMFGLQTLCSVAPGDSIVARSLLTFIVIFCEALKIRPVRQKVTALFANLLTEPLPEPELDIDGEPIGKWESSWFVTWSVISREFALDDGSTIERSNKWIRRENLVNESGMRVETIEQAISYYYFLTGRSVVLERERVQAEAEQALGRGRGRGRGRGLYVAPGQPPGPRGHGNRGFWVPRGRD